MATEMSGVSWLIDLIPCAGLALIARLPSLRTVCWSFQPELRGRVVASGVVSARADYKHGALMRGDDMTGVVRAVSARDATAR
jgi:hypothetical protein